MATNVIDVRRPSVALRETLRRLPELLSRPDQAGPAMQSLLIRVGLQALSLIRQAFIIKARGGTDDAGERWPSLSPATIAYSRRHPGVLWPGRKRAPYAPSWMLTKAQRGRWWTLMPVVGPAMAWVIIKGEGAKTLIGEYGTTPVEILRDTGLLLNSLSPGAPPVANANPGNVSEQVFRLEKAEVIVGTNRKHAGSHHRGIPGKLPQRRLWPHPARWPSSWWGEMLDQARQGMIDIVAFFLKRA